MAVRMNDLSSIDIKKMAELAKAYPQDARNLSARSGYRSNVLNYDSPAENAYGDMLRSDTISREQISPTHTMTRYGADVMANGVNYPSFKDGDRIYDFPNEPFSVIGNNISAENMQGILELPEYSAGTMYGTDIFGNIIHSVDPYEITTTRNVDHGNPILNMFLPDHEHVGGGGDPSYVLNNFMPGSNKEGRREAEVNLMANVPDSMAIQMTDGDIRDIAESGFYEALMNAIEKSDKVKQGMVFGARPNENGVSPDLYRSNMRNIPGAESDSPFSLARNAADSDESLYRSAVNNYRRFMGDPSNRFENNIGSINSEMEDYAKDTGRKKTR